MVCGQEKFPSPSSGQSASSGRPTEPTVGGRPLQASRTIPRQRARPAVPAATSPISVLHRAIFKTLGAFFCTFATLSFLRSRARSAGARLLHLVGSRLPSPYHFRARFNLFNLLRRHFRANSVLPSDPPAPRLRRSKQPRFKDRRSARRSPPGRRCENKYRTTTQLWQEIC